MSKRRARMARDAYATLGRVVLLLHIDRVAMTIRAEYNTMETNDGSDNARGMRALVESYDPARQVVIGYRDPARGRDTSGVVDLNPEH
jgi:hypothetical protein